MKFLPDAVARASCLASFRLVLAIDPSKGNVQVAVPTRIDSYKYREFTVVVARSGTKFLAVGRDSKSMQVAHASALSLEEVNIDIKRQLADLSCDYVGIDGAINQFLKAFPEGFSSAFYISHERSYKDRTVASVTEKLSEQRISKFIEDGDYTAVCSAAKETMNTSNLIFPNERMALVDALKKPATARTFSETLLRLLYRDFDSALEDLAWLLKPFGAATWTVLTFLPFFRFPEHHMFLKPTIYQNCAHQMGYEAHYDSMPNPKTYASSVEFAKFLADGLALLTPKDNIDIQTFMYAVGSKNYVQEAMKERSLFETARKT
jgi:hypothetical protein